MGEKVKEKQSRFSHLFLITKDTANISLANNPIQQTDTFPTTSLCIAKVFINVILGVFLLYNANHACDPKEEYTTVFCWRFSSFHSFDALSYFQEKSKGS